MACHHVVAAQVAFEEQILKPVFNFIGRRVETRRFQTLAPSFHFMAEGLKPGAFSSYGSQLDLTCTQPPPRLVRVFEARQHRGDGGVLEFFTRQLLPPRDAERAELAGLLGVALQVEFERQTLKPVFHLIGYRLWV
jgi:hypothetical protein